VSEPDRDYQEAVESLQADMARHQREYGTGEVTASDNHALAVDIVTRLEREHADRPSAPIRDVVCAPPPPMRTEREIDGRKYTVDASPEPERPYRTATEFEHNVMRHAMPRIKRLLNSFESGPLGTPSWYMRTLAANYFKVKAQEAHEAGRFDLRDEYNERFMQDLYELLEASNAKFGDWRKEGEQPTSLIVQV